MYIYIYIYTHVHMWVRIHVHIMFLFWLYINMPICWDGGWRSLTTPTPNDFGVSGSGSWDRKTLQKWPAKGVSYTGRTKSCACWASSSEHVWFLLRHTLSPRILVWSFVVPWSHFRPPKALRSYGFKRGIKKVKIDRPTPATQNGLGNVNGGWPRWMFCRAFKKHKLCFSWCPNCSLCFASPKKPRPVTMWLTLALRRQAIVKDPRRFEVLIETRRNSCPK